MIREYLLYHGYKNTLQAYEKVINRLPNDETKSCSFEIENQQFADVHSIFELNEKLLNNEKIENSEDQV